MASNAPDRKFQYMLNLLEQEAKRLNWTPQFEALIRDMWLDSQDWIAISDCLKYARCTPDQLRSLFKRQPAVDVPRMMHPKATLVNRIALELKFGVMPKEEKS